MELHELQNHYPAILPDGICRVRWRLIRCRAGPPATPPSRDPSAEQGEQDLWRRVDESDVREEDGRRRQVAEFIHLILESRQHLLRQ